MTPFPSTNAKHPAVLIDNLIDLTQYEDNNVYHPSAFSTSTAHPVVPATIPGTIPTIINSSVGSKFIARRESPVKVVFANRNETAKRFEEQATAATTDVRDGLSPHPIEISLSLETEYIANLASSKRMNHPSLPEQPRKQPVSSFMRTTDKMIGRRTTAAESILGMIRSDENDDDTGSDDSEGKTNDAFVASTTRGRSLERSFPVHKAETSPQPIFISPSLETEYGAKEQQKKNHQQQQLRVMGKSLSPRGRSIDVPSSPKRTIIDIESLKEQEAKRADDRNLRSSSLVPDSASVGSYDDSSRGPNTLYRRAVLTREDKGRFATSTPPDITKVTSSPRSQDPTGAFYYSPFKPIETAETLETDNGSSYRQSPPRETYRQLVTSPDQSDMEVENLSDRSGASAFGALKQGQIVMQGVQVEKSLDEDTDDEPRKKIRKSKSGIEFIMRLDDSDDSGILNTELRTVRSLPSSLERALSGKKAQSPKGKNEPAVISVVDSLDADGFVPGTYIKDFVMGETSSLSSVSNSKQPADEEKMRKRVGFTPGTVSPKSPEELYTRHHNNGDASDGGSIEARGGATVSSASLISIINSESTESEIGLHPDLDPHVLYDSEAMHFVISMLDKSCAWIEEDNCNKLSFQPNSSTMRREMKKRQDEEATNSSGIHYQRRARGGKASLHDVERPGDVSLVQKLQDPKGHMMIRTNTEDIADSDTSIEDVTPFSLSVRPRQVQQNESDEPVHERLSPRSRRERARLLQGTKKRSSRVAAKRGSSASQFDKASPFQQKLQERLASVRGDLDEDEDLPDDLGHLQSLNSSPSDPVDLVEENTEEEEDSAHDENQPVYFTNSVSGPQSPKSVAAPMSPVVSPASSNTLWMGNLKPKTMIVGSKYPEEDRSLEERVLRATSRSGRARDPSPGKHSQHSAMESRDDREDRIRKDPSPVKLREDPPPAATVESTPIEHSQTTTHKAVRSKRSKLVVSEDAFQEEESQKDKPLRLAGGPEGYRPKPVVANQRIGGPLATIEESGNDEDDDNVKTKFTTSSSLASSERHAALELAVKLRQRAHLLKQRRQGRELRHNSGDEMMHAAGTFAAPLVV